MSMTATELVVWDTESKMVTAFNFLILSATFIDLDALLPHSCRGCGPLTNSDPPKRLSNVAATLWDGPGFSHVADVWSMLVVTPWVEQYDFSPAARRPRLRRPRRLPAPSGFVGLGAGSGTCWFIMAASITLIWSVLAAVAAVSALTASETLVFVMVVPERDGMSSSNAALAE